jgi:hypothetical protein
VPSLKTRGRAARTRDEGPSSLGGLSGAPGCRITVIKSPYDAVSPPHADCRIRFPCRTGVADLRCERDAGCRGPEGRHTERGGRVRGLLPRRHRGAQSHQHVSAVPKRRAPGDVEPPRAGRARRSTGRARSCRARWISGTPRCDRGSGSGRTGRSARQHGFGGSSRSRRSEGRSRTRRTSGESGAARRPRGAGSSRLRG